MSLKESHVVSWWAVAALGLAGFSGFWINNRQTALMTYQPPRAMASGPRVRSFLMLRMPEVTAQYESGIDTMKVRIDQWLRGLMAAGFRPMLLSEVAQRLKQGAGLPEQTVVIFFTPGYRRTYEIVSPIFSRRQCPAVWLTREGATARADRRYITYHTARQMKNSGEWDVGYSDQPGIFYVESLQNKRVTFGNTTGGAWSPIAGAIALNRGLGKNGLNFLTVNADWEAEDLVNRLYAEAPANGPAYLTKAKIQNREWGVIIPHRSPREASFDLQVPWTKRSVKLFWLGTAGRTNFKLHAQSSSFIGELWFQLRFDEAQGDDVHLILSRQHLMVEEMRDHRNERLFTTSYDAPAAGMPWTMDMVLNQQTLSISMNGRVPRVIDHLALPTPGQGMVQVYLVDKLRGAANAKAVQLIFEPLSEQESHRDES